MANEITKPSLPKKVYDKIEENVVDLYIELELTIPINPIDIAKRLGYELHYLSEIKNPNEQKIISDAITHTCEGVSYFDSKHNTYLIWINDINSNYQPRLNFTIMHEIGPSALRSEIELVNTIAHELNHARSFIKGGNAPERKAYKAGNSLEKYMKGLK